MVEERSYYFPKEIGEIIRACIEYKSKVKAFSEGAESTEADIELLQELRTAYKRYEEVVPANVRKELGDVF